MEAVQGLHHITAVAKDPQRNVDFYRLVLGQRLVKRTVNFDDPGTYHFYFGDEVGTPGTILTFFPWRNVAAGRPGNGEATVTAYNIPADSLGYWRDRLRRFGVEPVEQTRFGAPLLSFSDPDGMGLELVGSDAPATAPSGVRHWAEGPVPADKALRGFHSVTLWLSAVDMTALLLTEQLGYTFAGQEENRYRYAAQANDLARYVDILHRPGQPPGRFGAGSIHHIAFRTVDDSEQLEYQQRLREAGQPVTPVRDRQYFHSIYFRSPGGVLFEIATDAPGFLYDEPVETLGESLKLPSWLEGERRAIEGVLPEFELKPVGTG